MPGEIVFNDVLPVVFGGSDDGAFLRDIDGFDLLGGDLTTLAEVLEPVEDVFGVEVDVDLVGTAGGFDGFDLLFLEGSGGLFEIVGQQVLGLEDVHNTFFRTQG